MHKTFNCFGFKQQNTTIYEIKISEYKGGKVAAMYSALFCFTSTYLFSFDNHFDWFMSFCFNHKQLLYALCP